MREMLIHVISREVLKILASKLVCTRVFKITISKDINDDLKELSGTSSKSNLEKIITFC